jgi:hypothetical protein
MAASTIVGASGRVYEPLPIDSSSALPNYFSYVFNGARYAFTLYVNTPFSALGAPDELMTLPDARRFLVVRADSIASDGTESTLFLRKVVPNREYEAALIALVFPTILVARQNLNGFGPYGTSIVGGIGQR